MADESEQKLSRRGGAGRSRRRRGPRMELKARVIPQAHAAVDARSAALGVTMSEYIEALVLQDSQNIGPDGVPIWWTRPVPGEEGELPLKSA